MISLPTMATWTEGGLPVLRFQYMVLWKEAGGPVLTLEAFIFQTQLSLYISHFQIAS